MSLLAEIFTDYTIRNVVLGTGIIGSVSGALGSFAVAAPSEWFPAPASILSATIGAIVVLGAWKWLKI